MLDWKESHDEPGAPEEEPGGDVGDAPGDDPDDDPDDDPAEDPGDLHGVPDVTLGGYFETHDRPPGFDGEDGQPYSVSMEVEKVASLKTPWVGYLVFPRWADTGLGVVGHVQTPILSEGQTYEEVETELGELSLYRVKELLDEAIRRRDEPEDAVGDSPAEEGDAWPGEDPREAEWQRWRGE